MENDDKEENTDEDELTPMVESPKKAELRESSKHAEPKVGTEEMVVDVGLKEPVNPVVSQEDITRDYTFIYFFCIYLTTVPL